MLVHLLRFRGRGEDAEKRFTLLFFLFLIDTPDFRFDKYFGTLKLAILLLVLAIAKMFNEPFCVLFAPMCLFRKSIFC